MISILIAIGLVIIICAVVGLAAFFHRLLDIEVSYEPYSKIVVWSYWKYFVFWWCIISPIAFFIVGCNTDFLFK